VPNFKRYYIPNALVFITTVTLNRTAIFAVSENAQLLLKTMQDARQVHPYHLLSYVILPDHVHMIMQASPEATFSGIMSAIKMHFTKNYKAMHDIQHPLTLWQGRFWDHIIRDDLDLARHMDYIHYNPVKHGYAAAPGDWAHSTFRYWSDKGCYLPDWGAQEPDNIRGMSCE
jgi:putative transposase